MRKKARAHEEFEFADAGIKENADEKEMRWESLSLASNKINIFFNVCKNVFVMKQNRKSHLYNKNNKKNRGKDY